MERAGWRGSGRRPSPSSWAMTPHFFLHDFWHLPACNAGSLSILEKRRGHTLIVMLGEYCVGEAEEGGMRAGERGSCGGLTAEADATSWKPGRGETG